MIRIGLRALILVYLRSGTPNFGITKLSLQAPVFELGLLFS